MCVTFLRVRKGGGGFGVFWDMGLTMQFSLLHRHSWVVTLLSGTLVLFTKPSNTSDKRRLYLEVRVTKRGIAVFE